MPMTATAVAFASGLVLVAKLRSSGFLPCLEAFFKDLLSFLLGDGLVAACYCTDSLSDSRSPGGCHREVGFGGVLARLSLKFRNLDLVYDLVC